MQGKAGRLYYQVIHDREVRQLKTPHRLLPEEWRKLALSLSDDVPAGLEKHLLSVRELLLCEQKLMRNIVQNMENRHSKFSANELVDAFKHVTSGSSVFSFMQSVVNEKRQKGCIRTSEAYQTTLNRFMRFREGEDLAFVSFDACVAESFERHLLSAGLRRNTSSFYLRILRTVYHLAVEQGLAEPATPFKHVYTGIDKTAKRAVPQRYIKKLKELDCSSNDSLSLARDLFLFSFYTRGMSFIDIAYLRKTDLKYGVLTYWRKKTGQRLDILWEREMQEIVERHPNAGGAYLLPIITKEDGTERLQYRNALRLINRKLKLIGRKIGLRAPLSMYAARHSWASIARDHNVPLAVISKGMGHDSESTTQIYLASLDASAVNKANRKILRML